MAFNTNEGRAVYSASASQTDFDFVFKIYTDEDILVYQTPAGETPSDADDLLTLTTDYTVAVTGDAGGTLTLNSGAAINDTITIIRSLDVTRTISYTNEGDLLSDTINEDQDYQTYLAADNKEENTRFLKLPDSSQGVNPELPATINDGYIKAKSDGSGFEYSLFQGSSFEDLVTVDTINDLTAIDVNLFTTAIVKDLDRGGVFNYDATQSAVNNSGTIFDGWVRQFSGAVNIKWFGAVGNGVTDDTVAIQAAIDSNVSAYIPPTTQGYKISASLVLQTNSLLFGDDKKSAFLFVDDGVVAIKVVGNFTTVKGFSITFDKSDYRDFTATTAAVGIMVRHPDSYGSGTWVGTAWNTVEDMQIKGAYRSIQVEASWWFTAKNILTLFDYMGVAMNYDQYQEFGVAAGKATTMYLERVETGGWSGQNHTYSGSTGIWDIKSLY